MGMKTVFFLGLIVGYMASFWWDNPFDTGAMVAQSKVIDDEIDCQKTPPGISIAAQAAETAKAKHSGKPNDQSDNAEGNPDTLPHDRSLYADIYDMQDAAMAVGDVALAEVTELEMQSAIDEAYKIQIEVEDIVLSTSENVDQYDQETGRKYDDIEQEEQLQANQLMDNGKLAVEEEIIELILSAEEEKAFANIEEMLESPDPVE